MKSRRMLRNFPLEQLEAASENFRWWRGEHLAHSVEMRALRFERGVRTETIVYVPAGSLPWNRPRRRKANRI